MLRPTRQLKGCTIGATDGAIGQVEDLYFDDDTWTVRYAVVDTGGWLAGRRVLLSPMSVRGVDWANRVVAVGLTREQVEKSPTVDLHRPVSRHYEKQHYRHYGHPQYWGAAGRWGAVLNPADLAAIGSGLPELGSAPDPVSLGEDSVEPHLRSARDVMGLGIHASDGAIGSVDDFLIEDDTWAIRYLIVDTGTWWPGKQVLVSPEWIERTRWNDKAVQINLTREQIEHAPEYDPARPLGREYEGQLFEHYRRRNYWDRAA